MRCLYMSGAGNDFMVIDGRGQNLNYEELSQKLCAITGADGFMALDVSDKADFRLHYYNADGSRGEMCGNGSRSICKFLLHCKGGRCRGTSGAFECGTDK